MFIDNFSKSFVFATAKKYCRAYFLPNSQTSKDVSAYHNDFVSV